MSALLLGMVLTLPRSLITLVEEVSRDSGLSVWLLARIVEVESSGNPTAIHRNADGTSDYGLMQINSFWVDRLQLDTLRLLSDPEYNLRVGAGILKKLIRRYGMTLEAIARYHSTNRKRGMAYIRRILMIR